MRTTRYLTACFAAGSILLLGSSASAATILHTLDVHFGAELSSGFLTAEYDDTVCGPDCVQLTFDSNDLSLSTEFVNDWWINYVNAGGATLDELIIIYVSGDVTTPVTIVKSLDGLNADGDGNFDIKFDFVPPVIPPGPGNNFDINEIVVFYISGTGITAADFDYFSVQNGGQGEYLSAAHIGGTCAGAPAGGPACTDNDDGSDFVGAVPEPGSVLLFATGLLVAGGLIRRDRRR